MSQSSVSEQVKDFASIGFPVRKGVRVSPKDGKISPEQFGSDLWFSRWARNAFRNYPIASKCFGIRFLYQACHGLPAFVVGVGPSLDQFIQDLKRAVGHSIIISTDAALRALLANGIMPDLVISYDCKDDQKRLWQDIPDGFKIPGLLNSCCHPDTIASWPGPILLYNQYHTQDELCKRILPDVFPELGQLPSCGTVGNMAVMAANLLACEPICVVGMDFCYMKSETGSMKDLKVSWRYRAQDYRYKPSQPEKGIAGVWEPTVIKELYDNDERLERSFMVKDLDGKEYKSDPELSFYLDSFKDLMPGFKIPIVNCSPGGRIPKLVTDLQGNTIGGFPAMTVGQAVDKYCKTIESQGGRHVLKHLAAIVPDPRKS
jgi:hypothetical protein